MLLDVLCVLVGKSRGDPGVCGRTLSEAGPSPVPAKFCRTGWGLQRRYLSEAPWRWGEPGEDPRAADRATRPRPACPGARARPPRPQFPPRIPGRRGSVSPARGSRKSLPGAAHASPSRPARPGRGGDSRGRRLGSGEPGGGRGRGSPREALHPAPWVGWSSGLWEGGALAGGARAVVGFEPAPRRPPRSGPGEPGEGLGRRLLWNWGPRRGAGQTCRAGLRAKLGAEAPSPPLLQGPGNKGCVFAPGLCGQWARNSTLGAGRGPSSLNCPTPSLAPAPPLGTEGSALTAGRGQALLPCPRRDPFWDAPGGNWRSPGGVCQPWASFPEHLFI